MIGEKLGNGRHEEVPCERSLHLDPQSPLRYRIAERALGIFHVVEDRETAAVVGVPIERRPDGPCRYRP